MTRRHLENFKLRNTLTNITSRMWNRYKWQEGDIRETPKFIFKFRFYDKGPFFDVTVKETGVTYSVEMFEDRWLYGDRHLWGVYHK